jgi:hypothetical protein
MASLEKHGLKAYLILDYGNRLYGEERAVKTDDGREAFSKWAAAAVTHFKGKGVCWEIWNEPNGGFWTPIANVHEYAPLALAASKAMRAAQPAEIITGPATSTIDMAFMESCFKAGLLEYWDAVTVHPYRQEGPESVEAEYHALRSLIARYAPAGKSIPILSGEWGYSSAWSNFDPEVQGRMLPRQWLMNAANKVPISIWYDWRDDGSDPKEAEHHFGTVELKYHEGRDPVFDPKPAYRAAKTYNTLLDGYKLVKRLSLGSIDHQAMLFERDGKFILAAWTTLAGAKDVRLPSDDGEFEVTSHGGEALPKIPASKGMMEFKVTDAVQYIHFGGVNRKLSAAPEALLVRLSIVPSAGKDLVAKIENFSERGFNAKVVLDGVKGLTVEETSRDADVPVGSGVHDVIFHLKETPAASYEVGLKLEVAGAVVGEIRPRLFSSPDPSVLAKAHAAGEGDAKVGGSFSITEAAAPDKFPGGDGRTIRMDYDFQPGWKYVPVYPSADAGSKTVEGRPGAERASVIFGIWIHGDASLLTPRLRVRDAGGRTWQPSGPDIKWKGWKYVEMKLDENTAHWGGEDDKVRRGPKFPLKWEAPFLLDNTQRTASKGSLYFTMPVVILE